MLSLEELRVLLGSSSAEPRVHSSMQEPALLALHAGKRVSNEFRLGIYSGDRLGTCVRFSL